MGRRAIICLLALLSIPLNGSDASAQSCADKSDQLYRSSVPADPEINPFRSSSSYLLWVDGQARILVDIGGGALPSLRPVSGEIERLSDGRHKPSSSRPRFRPARLPLVEQSDPQGAIAHCRAFRQRCGDRASRTFLGRLFDEKTGAFQVLGPTLGAKQGPRVEAFASMSASLM